MWPKQAGEKSWKINSYNKTLSVYRVLSSSSLEQLRPVLMSLRIAERTFQGVGPPVCSESAQGQSHLSTG